MTSEDLLEILAVINDVLESDPSILQPIVMRRFKAFINLARASLQLV